MSLAFERLTVAACQPTASCSRKYDFILFLSLFYAARQPETRYVSICEIKNILLLASRL